MKLLRVITIILLIFLSGGGWFNYLTACNLDAEQNTWVPNQNSILFQHDEDSGIVTQRTGRVNPIVSI